MSPLGPRESTRAMEKSPDAFRTISEVADDLDLPQHVLRFWETRFAQIKPLKRGGGRRYYRPDDVDLLKGIRHLLYGEGYTIKGVQRILKEDGIRFVQSVARGEQSVEPPPEGARREASDELVEVVEQAGGVATARIAGGAALSEREVARLKAALEDLLECERVLAALGRSGAVDEELQRN